MTLPAVLSKIPAPFRLYFSIYECYKFHVMKCNYASTWSQSLRMKCYYPRPWSQSLNTVLCNRSFVNVVIEYGPYTRTLPGKYILYVVLINCFICDCLLNNKDCRNNKDYIKGVLLYLSLTCVRFS